MASFFVFYRKTFLISQIPGIGNNIGWCQFPLNRFLRETLVGADALQERVLSHPAQPAMPACVPTERKMVLPC